MDKIAEIIEYYASHYCDEPSYGNPEHPAKQIRQQIGRELHVELTKAVIDDPRSDTAYGVNIGLEKAAIVTSKVCQLDMETEETPHA